MLDLCTGLADSNLLGSVNGLLLSMKDGIVLGYEVGSIVGFDDGPSVGQKYGAFALIGRWTNTWFNFLMARCLAMKKA